VGIVRLGHLHLYITLLFFPCSLCVCVKVYFRKGSSIFQWDVNHDESLDLESCFRIYPLGWKHSHESDQMSTYFFHLIKFPKTFYCFIYTHLNPLHPTLSVSFSSLLDFPSYELLVAAAAAVAYPTTYFFSSGSFLGGRFQSPAIEPLIPPLEKKDICKSPARVTAANPALNIRRGPTNDLGKNFGP